jgi:hypothetical protein
MAPFMAKRPHGVAGSPVAHDKRSTQRFAVENGPCVSSLSPFARPVNCRKPEAVRKFHKVNMSGLGGKVDGIGVVRRFRRLGMWSGVGCGCGGAKVEEVAVTADFYVAGQLEGFTAVAVGGEDQNRVHVRGVELAAARLYGFDEVADEASLHGAWLGQEFRERHATGLRIGVNEELGEKLDLILEERFILARQVGEAAKMIDDGWLEEALDERHKL